MKKNYYDILGITDEEKKLQGEEFEKILKKKYRKIALEKHPDRQSGKTAAQKKKMEEEFKEASEAYETLLNKRKEYDNPKSSFDFSGGGNGAWGNGFDDLFSHFGHGGFDFNFDSRNQQVKGTNIKITFELSLEDMMNGAKKKIKYRPLTLCTHCGGSGMDENSRKRTCKSCGGTGNIFGGSGFMHIRQTCPTCGGVGYIIENPCSHCNGHGIVRGEKEVELEVPKGVYDGLNLSYSGLGNAAPHGNGQQGDLIVHIVQTPHKKFERKGDDLYFNINLKIINALLGCKVNITTLDGRILQAKINKGTPDGTQLRFKGYGMPKFGNRGVGNMIGTVKLIMPSDLNSKEVDLLKELRKEEHFK